ncbi:hypothetical protein EYF80_042972 [Liparis tanakae]|uniref:Uncharacterized protein n=1 Tax=Liparis tanakae TaxID=230148 RepID=A0A4Z2G2S3_9TELE|nr:hypothetical protein EYF80_042972 [Liparis tanakae]
MVVGPSRAPGPIVSQPKCRTHLLLSFHRGIKATPSDTFRGVSQQMDKELRENVSQGCTKMKHQMKEAPMGL